MPLYLKDPDTRFDYAIDWSASYLEAQLVTQSEWSVHPDEAEGLAIEAHSHDGQKTAVTVTGGRTGHSYDLSNHVLLSNGERDTRSISLHVEKR